MKTWSNRKCESSGIVIVEWTVSRHYKRCTALTKKGEFVSKGWEVGRFNCRISFLDFPHLLRERKSIAYTTTQPYLHVCIMSHVFFSRCSKVTYNRLPVVSPNEQPTSLLHHVSTHPEFIGASNVSSSLFHQSVISGHPYKQNSPL